MTDKISIVTGRQEGRDAGWMVEERYVPEIAAIREKLQRAFGIPFDVVTTIRDENWEGSVWVGGKVVHLGIMDGKHKFRCENATDGQGADSQLS